MKVTIYSRSQCHLCEVAQQIAEQVQSELAVQGIDFEIEKILIDNNPDLEEQYGDLVPVTQIDGKQHDFFRIDAERLKNSLIGLHQFPLHE